MTRVYFVRHAQSDYKYQASDRMRPLTLSGQEDAKNVVKVLKDKQIDVFYCSTYKRSIDTIAETAQYYGKEIITDERLHERESGPNGNSHEMFHKRWADHTYHEDQGESLQMVQVRNMEALNEILENNRDKNIVIGTHGTALSTILNYYDPKYDCESFLRIINWMPYIIELDFEGTTLISKTEHFHVNKEFKK